MADSGASSKGGLFAKVIQKQVKRSKEKVLHKFGKADKTLDEIIDEHENNFNKQQAAATKLQKELKHYMQCVKAMSAASKNFYDAIGEVYECEWVAADDVKKAIDDLDLLWTDYMTKLQEGVSRPLSLYLEEFPEVKNKLNKRRRKLLDFDSARHNFEAQKMAKKKDDAKVSKAHDEFRDAKKIYEVINNELHDDLPELYDRRIDFYTTNLHTFFSSEATFMEESSKVKSQLIEIVDSLADEKQKGTYDTKRTPSLQRGRVLEEVEVENKAVLDDSTTGLNLSQYTTHPVTANEQPDRPSSQVSSRFISNETSFQDHSAENEEVVAIVEEVKQNGLSDEDVDPISKEKSEEGTEVVVTETPPDITYETVNVGAQLRKKGPRPSGATASMLSPRQAPKPVPRKSILSEPNIQSKPRVQGRIEEADDAEPVNSSEDASAIYSVPKDIDDTYVVPPSNQPVVEETADEIHYKVEATHPYTGEDTDELTFDKGDIICVVPFEDPEDQDEGWLMGYKLEGGERGVFPANFTKRL